LFYARQLWFVNKVGQGHVVNTKNKFVVEKVVTKSMKGVDHY
jgi:hypothetical protein